MAGREFLKRQALAAAALGHTLSVEQYGRGGVKFRAVCSCGYSSTQRRTQALALGAGFHHAGQVAAEASRNARAMPDGVSVPGSVSPRL